MNSFTLMIAVSWIAVSCLLSTPLTCAAENSVDTMQALEKKIDALIGVPRAKDFASCHAIPFGEKACGGPKRFLVFSTEKTSGEELAKLVDEYNQKDRAYNREAGIVSNCSLIREPTLQLANGVCVSKSEVVEVGPQ